MNRVSVVRLISTSLFVACLPLTVINGHGRGMIADPNHWQGYELITVFSFFFIKLGGGGFASLIGLFVLAANSFVVIGQWFNPRQLPFLNGLLCWYLLGILGVGYIFTAALQEGLFWPFYLWVASFLLAGSSTVMAYRARPRGLTIGQIDSKESGYPRAR